MTSLALLIPPLFLLNIALQIFDGAFTYHGLQIGIREANPLVQSSIAQWGVGWGLLYWKTFAGALLVFLRFIQPCLLTVAGLLLTAVCYVWFSFIPWLFIFVTYGRE